MYNNISESFGRHAKACLVLLLTGGKAVLGCGVSIETGLIFFDWCDFVELRCFAIVGP